MPCDARPRPGLFVTGTDTGVGKTRVAGWIAAVLAEQFERVGVCKPVVSGAVLQHEKWTWEDEQHLEKFVTAPHPACGVAPYKLFAPLAPPVAFRQDQQSGRLSANAAPPTIDDMLESIETWQAVSDVVVVEGVGGLLCPLTETETVADLAHRYRRRTALGPPRGQGRQRWHGDPVPGLGALPLLGPQAQRAGCRVVL